MIDELLENVDMNDIRAMKYRCLMIPNIFSEQVNGEDADCSIRRLGRSNAMSRVKRYLFHQLKQLKQRRGHDAVCWTKRGTVFTVLDQARHCVRAEQSF